MRIFHTADWHLGKLVQGVYMTEDQRYILEQFVADVEREKPDVVIIAGDLYDRAIPPTDAVHLLDEILEKIVLQLHIPVIAIAGNHDSPSRLHFGSRIMQANGYHIVGNFQEEPEPVILKDEHGEVHFHLMPYCDPSVVRNIYDDDTITSHNTAAAAIMKKIKAEMNPNARHVGIGHLFVTKQGEAEENTSESERPLSIGGTEYVDAHHYMDLDYMALGHLHQAHHVGNEKIRYAGSPMKYSISEKYHKKGYLIVELDQDGNIEVNKKLLEPKRDLRTVEGYMEDLLKEPINEDYVFVELLDENVVLSPMEKIKSVYPNAMHIMRKQIRFTNEPTDSGGKTARTQMSDMELFENFYEDVKGETPSAETKEIFEDVLEELLKQENETGSDRK